MDDINKDIATWLPFEINDTRVRNRAYEYFQTIPLYKTDRKVYFRRMQAWLTRWKQTPAATRHPSKSLLAFHKLLNHALQWLDFTDTEPVGTESTIQMFVGLARERFNVFYDTPMDEDDKTKDDDARSSQAKDEGPDSGNEPHYEVDSKV